MIFWVRSCGSYCKFERVFCYGLEVNKGLGLSFEYIRGVFDLGVRSRMGGL